MKYVSVLSLVHYCQAGQRFRQYYANIIPTISTEKLAVLLYLNIYWIHRGNGQEIASTIHAFREKIKTTSKNQINRLNLISSGDSLKNAFVNAHIATELLNFNIEKTVNDHFLSL